MQEIAAHLEHDPDGPDDEFGFGNFWFCYERPASKFINLPLTLIYPNKEKTMTEEESNALEDKEDDKVGAGSDDPVYDPLPNGKSYIEAYHLNATLDGIDANNFNPGLDESCIYHVTAENISDVFLVNDSGDDLKFNYNDHIVYVINKYRVKR